MQKPKKVLHFSLSSAPICTFLFICSSKGKGKGLTSTNSAYFNKKKQNSLKFAIDSCLSIEGVKMQNCCPGLIGLFFFQLDQ